jgi:methylated-DNA-[protein]-cysteine S-methyltransferase
MREVEGMRFSAKMTTPFAVLGVASDGCAVTRLAYLPRDEPEQAPADRVAEQVLHEVERYLADPAFRFTVPLAPRGTAFQQRVWQQLHAIPIGHSRTYGEVARMVRSAPRAIGQACGANRIALIIPCHRVVGAQGSMGGFMNADEGDPIAIKRWLLMHEGYRFGA